MTTPTTNYSWGKPVNGASADTWGTELNTLIDAIDTQVKANDTSAKNASSLSSGTVPDARLSGNLSSIAALTSAADRVPYYTGANTAQLATFTSYARSLVANADAASSRSTLGVYSTTQIDANYCSRFANLNDVANTAATRVNLGITTNLIATQYTVSTSAPSLGADGDLWFKY